MSKWKSTLQSYVISDNGDMCKDMYIQLSENIYRVYIIICFFRHNELVNIV